jgi:hypothetical protein
MAFRRCRIVASAVVCKKFRAHHRAINHQLFHTSPCIHGNASSNSARVSVPSLGQNSTLVLRSKSKSLTQIQIIPQWRDDTLLELIEDGLDVDGVSTISPVTAEPVMASVELTQKKMFGNMELTFHKDGIETSLGRVETYVEVDLLDPNDKKKDELHNDINNSMWKLVATVPEKSNISCQVVTGDINVEGKLEGDVHLATSNDSNITVSKLRGHSVSLNNTNKTESSTSEQKLSCISGHDGGAIYIKKAIEARTVQISASQRVRARMINGSDIEILVKQSPDNECLCPKLDEDDEGAIVDVGSLYISHGGDESEARLVVDTTHSGSNKAGIIRVKSNHGHVTIHAKINRNVLSNEIPLVDLGGVNGSCDVLLEAPTSNGPTKHTSKQIEHVANRIHFDAFAPESISTITCRGHVGDTSITIDRKLDADLRLLSLANLSAALPNDLDAHSISSDDTNDIQAALQSLEKLESRDTGLDGVLIETDAFEANKCPDPSSSFQAQYVQGRVQNRSGEPDSRFDVQSRGKINKDGAALQALHGFHSKTNEDSKGTDKTQQSSVVLPLLSVVTDGKIKLETLSWLGSIARRYGLEENQEMSVGRQASRKPRLEK